LFKDACEDKTLRPSAVSEETVYEEMRTLGKIFNVDAEALVKEMKEDFDSAAAMMKTSKGDTEMTAVWLDCVGRCCKNDKGIPQVFVGSGQGAPAMLMREAGLKNVFENKEGNWVCVKVSEVVAANPDVLVVVDADWDKALDKITWLYNHTDFCDMDILKGGRMVQIPFSASTLSPRNGPAALDLTIASLHVRKGTLTAVRKSGVSSFNPKTLREHTKGLKCTMVDKDVVYDDKPKDHDDHDGHDHDEKTTSQMTNTADNPTQEANHASGHPQPRSLALGLGFVLGLPIFMVQK